MTRKQKQHKQGLSQGKKFNDSLFESSAVRSLGGRRTADGGIRLGHVTLGCAGCLAWPRLTGLSNQKVILTVAMYVIAIHTTTCESEPVDVAHAPFEGFQVRGVSRPANDRFVAVSWGCWFLVGLALVFFWCRHVPDGTCSKYASFFFFLCFFPARNCGSINGYGVHIMYCLNEV